MLATFAVALSLLAASSPASAAKPYSLRLVDQTYSVVGQLRGCEAELGRREWPPFRRPARTVRQRQRSLRLWTRRERSTCGKLDKINASPEVAICYVFGSYCSQAKTVARCESAHGKYPIPYSSVWARNGQYVGLFQMGDRERAIYGYGVTPLAQSRGAYNYFVSSGRDWSPWDCRP